MKKLVVFVLVVLATSLASAAEYATFDSFYSGGGIGFLGWCGIVLGSIAVGVLVYCSAGTGSGAVPAWMATVAGWIGSAAGYSGAAAVSYGLALLGGGSVAAGGLGMAGGMAVLAAAASFGTDIVLSYTVDSVCERWEMSAFVEANKEMLTLPIPRNEDGGDAYEFVVGYLHDNINKELLLQDDSNQKVLAQAKSILAEKMKTERDNDYQTKDQTLMALLCLQTMDFRGAYDWGELANKTAVASGNKSTLPLFIMGLAELSVNEDVDVNSVVGDMLAPAYRGEPKNKLMNLMTACCADRLGYRFHYGRIGAEDLRTFWLLATDRSLDEDRAAESINILVTRVLVELKRNQQDILCVCKDETGMIDDDGVVVELERRLGLMKALIDQAEEFLVPRYGELEDDMPEEAELKAKDLQNLLTQYRESLPELERLIHSHDAPVVDRSIVLWLALLALATGMFWLIKRRRDAMRNGKQTRC